jgi:hypothetical protein
MNLFGHLVGLLGRGISLQRTTQHRKTRTLIHAPSRIRTCDPNVRAAQVWNIFYCIIRIRKILYGSFEEKNILQTVVRFITVIDLSANVV